MRLLLLNCLSEFFSLIRQQYVNSPHTPVRLQSNQGRLQVDAMVAVLLHLRYQRYQVKFSDYRSSAVIELDLITLKKKIWP